MNTRSLWFEPHLFSDRAGRQARDLGERLGPEIHQIILAGGDRLATLSPLLAQRYYRTAPGMWQVLGERDFHRWFDLGYGLIAQPLLPRDAATAYFSVDAKTAARLGIDGFCRWCDLGASVARDSRKLAATFFVTTAPLLCRLRHEQLEAWVRTGRRLQHLSGWRGEFLAQAYFASGAVALPVLEEDEFEPWARLGTTLQSVAREQHFFGSLPQDFAHLKPDERRAVIVVATVAANTHLPAALSIYRQLPQSVRLIRGPTRLRVLQILQEAAAQVPLAVAEIAPVVGALVNDLPASFRSGAIDLAVQVAERFPRGSVALLRSLPAAYEDAGHDAVRTWAEHGLRIAAENPEAGDAYYALESRTSLNVLHASTTAAQLNEVQGLLRKYVQMLSGQPATIRSSEALMLRPPLEEFPQENEIELPLRIDLFATHEGNTETYRFVAAQLAGRREFGTYEPLSGDFASETLYAYLHDTDRPRLLREWFLAAEGFRIASALGRNYGGLAREQRSVARRLLERLTSDPGRLPPSPFDLLYLWLVSGGSIETLPEELQYAGAIVSACTIPLASPEATVTDTLRIAELLTESLAEHTLKEAALRGTGVLSDQMTGDALIASYLYDDDDSPLPQGEGDVDLPAEPSGKPLEIPSDLALELSDEKTDEGITAPLSADALKQLLESGVDLNLKQGSGQDLEGLGLFITDLMGKIPSDQLEELRNLLNESVPIDRPPPRRWMERRSQGIAFYYDEWDYHIADYRQRWCRLLEMALEGDSGEFFNNTLSDYAAMIPEVRRQFQKIRPDTYRLARGLEDGEDFDLNAVVNARVDRRARRSPSPKLYVARQREERDVATLFLIDMSASTDEPMKAAGVIEDASSRIAGHGPSRPGRRIIDVTKEALVIMSEALEEIGDAYAIYGFSGHGRENVEFYLVKSFRDSLNLSVKGRIGGIEPRRSTRMGTALRHAMEKMAGITARSRHLILLSDGFPQDFDYGQDRRSNVYGLRDTSVALRECEAAGVTPFCITVDKAGHDYLREMCPESRYMVIDDIGSLPRELPKIYQRVVTA